MPLICSLCSYEQTASLNFNLTGFLKHIELFHSHQPSFSITCGLGGCLRTFQNFKVFRNHVYSLHGGEANISNQPNNEFNDDGDSEDSDGIDLAGGVPCNPIEIVNVDDIQRSSALFLMGMKEKYKLTQTALQGIVEGVSGLMRSHLSVLHTQISSVLPQNLSANTLSDIERLFSDERFCHPFLGLETEHQQMKFIRRHFQFTVCYF